jgi:hypothetical protein
MHSFLMHLPRDWIAAGNTADLLKQLNLLIATQTQVRQYEDAVTLVFPGYDNDDRELFEIPEVVRYFRAASELWPYWFHFLSKKGPSLAMVMWLLCDVETKREGGKALWRFRNMSEAKITAASLNAAVGALHRNHGIEQERTRALSQRISQSLIDAFAGDAQRSGRLRSA